MMRKNKTVRCAARIGLVLLCLLILPLCAAAEDEETNAREITRKCLVTAPNHADLKSQILDRWLNGAEWFTAKEPVKITWNTDQYTPHWVCVQWERLPNGAKFAQYGPDGALLSEKAIPNTRYDTTLELLPETGKAELIPGEKGMAIARIAIYEEGILPDVFTDVWQDTPDHLDYLVIATHPDDDVLFLGTVHPVYGAERGYCGTTAFVTAPNRERIGEGLAGVKTEGCTYYPLFLGFPDVPQVKREQEWDRFRPSDVQLAIVRLFRAVRPLVVFTQDRKGE